jgi:hypothetical protein
MRKIGSRTNCAQRLGKGELSVPLTYVLADRTADEETHHVETTLELVAVGVDALGRPLLGLGVEVVVSPQLGHELVLRDTELLGVTGGELTEGEGPSVETGTERDGALLGVDLAVAEGLLVVHRDDDVDRLDGTGEGLVEVLLLDLELEEGTVDLVDDDDRLDALTERLTEDGLGLDADTVDGVDDDEGTVSDTEGGRDLGREVDVTRRVDQVDQEVTTCEPCCRGSALWRSLPGTAGRVDTHRQPSA